VNYKFNINNHYIIYLIDAPTYQITKSCQNNRPTSSSFKSCLAKLSALQ